jgi:hypothetical protein
MPPTSITDAFSEEDTLSLLISHKLKMRVDWIKMIENLEETCNNAGKEIKSLNSKTAALGEKEAKQKREKLQVIEQKLYFAFDPLTDTKHLEQIRFGKEILKELHKEIKNKEDFEDTKIKAERFIDNEKVFEIEFLRKKEECFTLLKQLQTEIFSLTKAICSNPQFADALKLFASRLNGSLISLMQVFS